MTIYNQLKFPNSSIGNTSIAAGAVSPDKLDSVAQRLGMKNRIINGAMVIDQRNAGASVTPASDSYILDRYKCVNSQVSKLSFQQSTTAPNGFANSLVSTATSSYSVISSDYFSFIQRIEGFNISDLGWGSANAQTVTLSFLARSSLTGTFGVLLRSGNEAQAYPTSYTINSANTWEYKTITIAGPTTGGTTAFPVNNTAGLGVWFSLGAGSANSGNATQNTWGSTFCLQPAGAVNLVGTSGATLYITGVQLEVGSSATGFEYRQYGQELALCQRYCFVETNANTAYRWFATGQVVSGTTASLVRFLPVPMRVSPSFTTSGASGFITDTPSAGSACSAVTDSGFSTPTAARIFITSSSLTQGQPASLASDGTSNLRTITFSAEL